MLSENVWNVIVSARKSKTHILALQKYLLTAETICTNVRICIESDRPNRRHDSMSFHS